MIDTLVGYAGPKYTYASDFNTLCKEPNAPGGCAMMAFEVYGGDNREISKFAYQPGIVPAFFNTFYNAKTMFLLAKNPPTQLIETYYTCVLSQWQSFYQAAGLANSNVQLYLSVAFMVYMYIVVFYHQKVLNVDVKLKSKKEAEAAVQEDFRQAALDEVLLNFGIMKIRFDALVEDAKAADKDFVGFKTAIAITEIKDLDEINSKKKESEGKAAEGELVVDEAAINKELELSSGGGYAMVQTVEPHDQV